FYLYFRDKRSVFIELVDSLFSRLSSAILHVDTDGDIEGQVKHNMRAIIAVLLDDPLVTEILLARAAIPDETFLEKIRSFYEGVKRLLASTLASGQEMGIVAPGDVNLFATFTIGALKECLLESAMTFKTISREELVRDLYGLLQGGFLRMDGRTKAVAKPASPAAPAKASSPAAPAAVAAPATVPPI